MSINITLITSVTGKDGLFLSEFLLGEEYGVYDNIRRSTVDYRERIVHTSKVYSNWAEYIEKGVHKLSFSNYLISTAHNSIP